MYLHLLFRVVECQFDPKVWFQNIHCVVGWFQICVYAIIREKKMTRRLESQFKLKFDITASGPSPSNAHEWHRILTKGGIYLLSELRHMLYSLLMSCRKKSFTKKPFALPYFTPHRSLCGILMVPQMEHLPECLDFLLLMLRYTLIQDRRE